MNGAGQLDTAEAPTPWLRVATAVEDGRAVVTVAGELDVYTCAELDDTLLALAGAGHHRVALDLAALVFCDSSGLGILIGAYKRATVGGGGLALVDVHASLLRTLHITGLTRLMPAFPALAEAFVWLDAQ
jgi:anti-sigma B factor antagonist